MSEKTAEKYNMENDPEMVKYWMLKGPKTAAFLLVIPGCTIVGFGAGLLQSNPVPYVVMGFGVGMLLWGFIVALTK